MANDTEIPKRIVLVNDFSAKSFAYTLVAREFGADGVYVRNEDASLNDDWVSLLDAFNLVLFSFPTVPIIEKLASRVQTDFSSVFEKSIWILRDVSDVARVDGALKIGLELIVEKEDYALEEKKFVISNPTKYRVESSLPRTLSLTLLSFSDNDSHPIRGPDPFVAWDLIRSLLLTRASSGTVFLHVEAASSRDVWRCGQIAVVDGVVLEAHHSAVNPGVFSAAKPWVTVKDVTKTIGNVLTQRGADDSLLTEFKRLLDSFWKRIDASSDSLKRLDEVVDVESFLGVIADVETEMKDGTKLASLVSSTPRYGEEPRLKLSKSERFVRRRNELKLKRRRKKEINRLRGIMGRLPKEEVAPEDGDDKSDNDDDNDDTGSRKRKNDECEDSILKVGRIEAQHAEKEKIRASLQKSMSDSEANAVLKVALDLSFGPEQMSDKEMGRLAVQVMRIYGSNRRASKPARIDLCGVGPMRRHLEAKFKGFEQSLMGKSEKSPMETYADKNLDFDFVFLTPDSSNVLNSLSASSVYILGGLVDESVTRNLTLAKSRVWDVNTARLPIREHMDKMEASTASFNPVLTVNQVFDILMEVFQSGDWKRALTNHVPVRKGFVVKTD